MSLVSIKEEEKKEITIHVRLFQNGIFWGDHHCDSGTACLVWLAKRVTKAVLDWFTIIKPMHLFLWVSQLSKAGKGNHDIKNR